MHGETGYMENARGHLVPVQQVGEYDRLRDELVRELIGRARTTQQELIHFKLTAMGDCRAFLDLALEKYGVKRGRGRGNVQLVSFDGKQRVQIAVADFITFDENLVAAKALVDECLTDWTEDARSELKTLVTQAFDVDKEGNVSTGKVLSLLQLEIDDERWHRAMEAIRDSISVQRSKTYIRFHERADADAKWETISLDIAAL
jgi:hypothetical protein